MKYKATICFSTHRLSETFCSVGEAEQWIDSNNNNYDYVSYIQELDAGGNVLDWFYYTERR